jgi:hypothetical protein
MASVAGKPTTANGKVIVAFGKAVRVFGRSIPASLTDKNNHKYIEKWNL